MNDIFNVSVEKHEDCKTEKLLPQVDLQDLAMAFMSALSKAENFKKHHIKREQLSTRGRMSSILDKVKDTADFVSFSEFYTKEEGRAGIVVSFLAILELTKEGFIEIQQHDATGALHVRRVVDASLDLERIS